MWMGITQSAEGINRTKRKRKVELTLPGYFSWDIDLLLPLGLLVLRLSDPDWNLYYQLSDSQAFKLHHWLSWVSSLQMADRETSQPLKSCEQISYNKSLHIHLLLVLFLWRTLTQILSLPDPQKTLIIPVVSWKYYFHCESFPISA